MRRTARLALALAVPALVGAFQFLSIGDWGDDNCKENTATAFAQYAADGDAQFVLAIGDNMYDSGVKSVDDPQWETTFEQTMAADALDVPWYVAGGNHDYYGSIDAQIDYSQKSSRWTFPSYYYKEDVDIDGVTVLLVALDTWRLNGGDTYVAHDPKTGRSHLRSRELVLDAHARGAIEAGTRDVLLRRFVEHDATADASGEDGFAPGGDDEQLAWLAETLAGSDATWKVVFGHFPIYSATTGEHGDTPALAASLLPVLQQGGADLYLSGHDHILQHIYKDGIHFLGTGAGARTHTGVDAGYEGLEHHEQATYGFTVHAASATELTTTMVTTLKNVAAEPYSFTITKST